MMTEIEKAKKNAANVAYGLGVRTFVYQDLDGRPVLRAIKPAAADEHLDLVETFEPPPPTIYEGSLPPAPEPA